MRITTKLSSYFYDFSVIYGVFYKILQFKYRSEDWCLTTRSLSFALRPLEELNPREVTPGHGRRWAHGISAKRRRGRVREGAELVVGLTYGRFWDLDGAGERPAVGFDGQVDLRPPVLWFRRGGSN
jgi:hypothetical protein